ncbi:hypothetical protein DPMN_071989 [Dreissena polymorpha]|uniref:Uncharacterized protein n=1 Tax=Dreissena polymorpha TaxID=45954 RepID=A0A9D4BW61_DREPO|nr:hypothetical protein DPMN_071989 [Dreissena polymorpha]
MYRRILVSLIVAILCCVVFVNAQRNRKLCHQYDGICQDARWTTALGFPTCATLKAGYTCKDIHGLCRCVASHSGRWFMTGGDRQPTEEE